MRLIGILLATSTVFGTVTAGGANEASIDNITAVSSEDGRYFTEDDVPTYNVAEDGTIDWPSYSGFRRYHSECHVCHGPEGEGSSYAPALKKSAIDMDYYEFIGVVAEGRKRVGAATNSVMPSLGNNPNVMCYLDDIYVYLKGRGTDAIPRGRPGKKEAKSDVIREDENSCIE
jgi:methanol metabolism-related c-type cytochrome